jgi:imidazolonepropionase-like amidohydrolase
MKALLTLAALCIASPLFAQVLAIRAGAVIDPARGLNAKDQVILVEKGKIAAIGAGLAIPAGAQVIDLSHEWMTPGLIDAHTHMSLAEYGPSVPFETYYLDQSSALRGLQGLHNVMQTLQAGFTSLRDVGNSAEWVMSDVRRAIDAGWFAGPTIIDSGKIIAPFGGQSQGIPPEQGRFWRFEYLDADGPDEVRKAVRTDIYYGAGVIKLVPDNNRYHYSVDEIRAAVDEAHRAGLPVAVHCYTGAAADTAIEAGADSIEHGFELTDAGGGLPAPAVLAPQIIDRLQRAHRIGVRLAFGTDTTIDVPGRTRADLMLDYLAVWRAAGVPPADILRAMTGAAAELLRINQARGGIAVGLAADLVAMPANPLDDIENLRRIDFVMKDGRIVRRP